MMRATISINLDCETIDEAVLLLNEDLPEFKNFTVISIDVVHPISKADEVALEAQHIAKTL